MRIPFLLFLAVIPAAWAADTTRPPASMFGASSAPATQRKIEEIAARFAQSINLHSETKHWLEQMGLPIPPPSTHSSAPSPQPEAWRREFERRFGAAAPSIETGLHHARQVLPVIAAAFHPSRPSPANQGWSASPSLGANLSDYARNEGADPERFETFIEAARRILAGSTTTKVAPDVTSLWLDRTADAILAAVRAAEIAAGHTRLREIDDTLSDLRILAQFARFHARRAIAAVHFNLFTRGLKLAELLAATMQEKEAVAIWRQLVTLAGPSPWRDELKRLEANLKELEEQCCPPDEAIMKEPVWLPATDDPRVPPRLPPTQPPAVRE